MQPTANRTNQYAALVFIQYYIMSSWTCELSGEPLQTATDEIVVTPSGHVCLKRLLLTKLAENGGTDPFETERDLPLVEDSLVTLKRETILPPRPHVTSLPSLLRLMHTEYEALTLELFDTRKALEETRKELSHALYQNDAAVRVVARLAMERDQARAELAQWQTTTKTTTTGAGDAAAATAEAPQITAVVEQDAPPPPPAKKRKVEEEANSIPQEDLDLMISTWQTLSQQRKQQKKKDGATSVIPPETLEKFTEVDKKSWHKPRNKAGIVAMCGSESLIVTAGRDKQLVVYSLTNKTLVHAIATMGLVASSVDVSSSSSSVNSLIAAGLPGGKLVLYSADDGSILAQVGLLKDATIVDVALHPTGRHVVATTEDGTISLLSIEGDIKKQFTSSPNVTYTSGELHPDGLIYAAGTSEGKVHLVDFKSQQLASTLESEETKGEAIVAISFSNNGYHLAIATASVVQVLDIKKSKVLTTIKGEDIQCVKFDPSGKYVAYGGAEGATIVTPKEGTTVATIAKNHTVGSLIWTADQQIVTCGDADREVRFHGLKDSDEMKD
jgi:pre-mRNA-processing factor 19